MSDLHVVPGNEGFGLIDHIKAIDERLGRIEMLLEAKFSDGSGSYKYNEPVDWTKTQGAGLTSDTSAPISGLPTQAQADVIAANARAEREARRAA
jgi:hypothetical protein